MRFKGRTVIAIVFIAIFASSLVTLTVVDASFFQGGKDAKETVSSSASNQSSISDTDLQKISTTYELIRKQFIHTVKSQTVVDGAISGMLSSLDDPYTVYMNQDEAKKFNESLAGSFTGIGAEVSLENGRVTVVSPIKNSPAERAGIHAKDMILSVNGEKLDGLSLNEAILKIRGPKGSQAKLEILRPGSNKAMEMIVVRDDIDYESVYMEMLPGKIGKIEIRQFSQNTAERFLEDLKSLEGQGMKGLIIDVRDDPGGILPIVREIIDPFVPKGQVIYQVEERAKLTKTESKGTGKQYPIAVLINKGSASASEILAAALHETIGSKLIGETSFGKGSVQVPIDMPDGSNIKITIAKWLTPKGNWIHGKGIKPDLAVAQPDYFTVAPLSKKTTLVYDTVSDDNKNLQLMLKGIGLKPGRTDGYYGKETQEAVKAFQHKQGIAVSGAVDKGTAERLEKAVLEQMQKPENDLQLQAAVDYLKKTIGQNQ